MDRIIQMNCCMPNHIQKIKFITMFTFEIQLTRCFQSLQAYLTTPTWNSRKKFNFYGSLTKCRTINNFMAQLILDIKLTHYLPQLWECLTKCVSFMDVQPHKKIQFHASHIVYLTLPPHIVNKPWISRKNEKAVKIMIKTLILLWKTIEGNRTLRVRVRVRFL